MPFRQYHTSVFWSTQIIWELPHSQTQVMTEFILKDEVILLSLISLSPQAALLLYLWSCLHLSIFGPKMESFPESLHFLASLNLLYLMLQKGGKKNVFSLNNRKMLSVFPPFPAMQGGATFLSLQQWVLVDWLTSGVLAILFFVPGVFMKERRGLTK